MAIAQAEVLLSEILLDRIKVALTEDHRAALTEVHLSEGLRPLVQEAVVLPEDLLLVADLLAAAPEVAVHQEVALHLEVAEVDDNKL